MSLNNILLTAITCLLFSCSSLNLPPKKKTEPNLKNSLLAKDQAVLNLAVILQKLAAENVWPGFSNFTTSVVYFTKEAQFLFNPQGQVPSEYVPTSSIAPSWSPRVYSTTKWIAPDGTQFTQQEIDTAYLANAFSSQQTDGHFSYSVFFLDSIERFHFKDMKWDVDDWLAIFWHEVFHNYQDSLYKPELVVSKITDFTNVKSYIKSEKFLKTIKVELKTVSQALKSPNLNRKRDMICKKFIPIRTARYKSMPPESVETEQFYEISEGTARYVEELMSLSIGKLLKTKENQSKFSLPNFHSFEKYEKRDRSYYYESIHDVSPQKRYFYNTGFALALLLDQVKPNWKSNAFQERGFLFSQVKSWCQTSVLSK